MREKDCRYQYSKRLGYKLELRCYQVNSKGKNKNRQEIKKDNDRINKTTIHVTYRRPYAARKELQNNRHILSEIPNSRESKTNASRHKIRTKG